MPFTMSGTDCHGVWSKCMPSYIPGFTGSGNEAPSGGRTPNEWFNTANYVEAFSNQADGIADERQRGPAVDYRPAHGYLELLDVQAASR